MSDQAAAPGADTLFAAIYEELRLIAGRTMSRERREHTLQPTALVNEAYLKLRNQRTLNWNSESHFIALASQAMRQLLIDHARRRNALRRTGERVDVDLDRIQATGSFSLDELIALHEALDQLAREEPRGPRHAQLVRWVWLGGMSLRDAAAELGITERQAQRDWAWARTWLARRLRPDG